MKKAYNIRVYGLLINSKREILLSDERYAQLEFTKFPGGGHEWGEGLAETVTREFMEELNQQVKVIRHFYTTEHFLSSAFDPDQQLISVYFLIEMIGAQAFETLRKPFAFEDSEAEKTEGVRWVPLPELHSDMVRWPVDKLVVAKLREELL